MSSGSERTRLAEAVLTAAELEGDERDAYLASLAETSPLLAETVRERVERAERAEDSFLETPAAERLGQEAESAAQASPRQSEEALLLEARSLEERYELGEPLGEGGMGRVLLAHDRRLGRRVAMKFLHRADPDVVGLLLREARLQAMIQHPHVLEIFDSGVLDGSAFIAMRHVAGGTLADLGSEEPLDRRVKLLAQAAEGLHAAHRMGLLHCDVKPSNILVDESDEGELRALVTDFGLAIDPDRASHGVELGGTPQYVAPERLLDESAADRRSDVYSFGATMYRVLTGALPFGEVRTMEILRGAVAGEVQPPRQHTASLPVELEAIILRCMARNPEDRYSSARAVADDLQRYLDGEVVEAYAAGLAYRLTRFALRNRPLVALAGGALVALLAASVAVAVFAVRADLARDEAEVRQGQAEELIGFMVGDLREKLAKVGRLEILEDVGTRAMTYFEQVPEDALSTEEKSRRAQALRQIGQIRRTEGDLDGADDAFRRSLELTQALAAAAPEDGRFHVELCAALFWVGMVQYEEGHFSEALPYMQRYLEIAEAWVEKDPSDQTWRLEFAQATSNVGSIVERMGDADASLAAYEKRLLIVTSLLEEDPGNVAWRMDLSLTHNNVGYALECLGRLEEAERQYRLDLDIKASLLAEDPSNALWAQRLATSHFYLGDNLLQRGLLEEAEREYGAQLRLAADLVARDPRNGAWQRELAVAQHSLGTALAWQGRFDAAKDHFQQAVATLEALAADESPQREWMLQLAVAELKLSEALQELGASGEAERRAESALAMLGGLDPPEPERVAEAYLTLGTMRQADGDVAEARESWSRAAALIEPLALAQGRPRQLGIWARALLRLGRSDEAAGPLLRLDSYGYRHPELDSLRSDV